MHSNYAVAGSPSIRLVWLVSITTVSFQNWFLKQSLLKWKHEEDNRRGVAIKCAFKYWHFQNWRHPPPCLPINRSIDQTLILGLQFTNCWATAKNLATVRLALLLSCPVYSGEKEKANRAYCSSTSWPNSIFPNSSMELRVPKICQKYKADQDTILGKTQIRPHHSIVKQT